MPILSKKPAPTPTLDERLDSSHATAEAAISVIEGLALDLERAASEEDAIVSDIDVEVDSLYAAIDRLANLREEATEAKASHLAKATNIRALISA